MPAITPLAILEGVGIVRGRSNLLARVRRHDMTVVTGSQVLVERCMKG
jgi:hypothetical protein